MNRDVRTAEGADGTLIVLGAWCPMCRQESMPNSNVFCMWCDTRILAEEGFDASAVHHGTYRGYATLGCRCTRCRDANAAYQRAYRERKAAA